MNQTHEPDNPGILRSILFPAGVLVTLVLAYLLDRWLFAQTRLVRTGQFSPGIEDPLFVWTVASGLVLFAAWLALSWIALTRSQSSLPVSIIILIVGLIIYLYPYLEMMLPWLPMLFFTVRTPLAYSGLFVVMLSVLQLLIKPPAISIS